MESPGDAIAVRQNAALIETLRQAATPVPGAVPGTAGGGHYGGSTFGDFGNPAHGPGSAETSSAPPRQLDELVDLVVERIEQRVIDELERRGRRGMGGF